MIDIPLLGNITLAAVLISATGAATLALLAVRVRPAWLSSSRYAAVAACALVGLAVCLLAYAFQTHDFRIRYVARYSDRSMPWWYLVTSLWGGQDGSLLWWTLLLAFYTGICVRWMRDRYLDLQPYVIATLMSIMIFFVVLMLFAANPFATSLAATPADGEGLNPLLQNYWMTIHPPSLYLGFVGWSVPFSFAIAALISGQLGEEWIYAIRRWVLVAWLFLSIGNLLGALWSYEELGWGGYWAWDPVENAAFMPWLSATAFLHSTMIQERRGILKMWNVFLLCLTFIMTIFGTFLTRSGLIASVHSFAKSDIGIYFVSYLIILVVGCFGLIYWRAPLLRGKERIDSPLSREFAFLTNNWILLGMQFFVLLATTFPLISEALRGETVTVGPSYYNAWMAPLGLILLLLAGIGPLMAWRKASGKSLLYAFIKPLSFALLIGGAHFTFGARFGFPAVVRSDAIYDDRIGAFLAKIYAAMPGLSIALCAFVLATVVQEFARGVAMRRRSAEESVPRALFNLVAKARRRYGGYVVHVGIVLMFLGFTGGSYDVEKEAALRPGHSMKVGDYTLKFERPRIQADGNKEMHFADMRLSHHGRDLGIVSPAKFLYRTHPEMPTTEVAIHSSLLRDVYVILNSVNPETKLGTFKVIIRPLVAWIWLGGLVLILGVLIAAAPSMRELLGPRLAPIATQLLVACFISMLLAPAWAAAQSDSSSSLHAGHVSFHNETERKLFARLLCQCGDCARLPLSTCACGWADDMRQSLRKRLASGETTAAIEASYREEFGPKSLALPSDKGLDRALWAVPISLLVLAGIGLLFRARLRIVRPVNEASPALAKEGDEKYDQRLKDELDRIEEDA